MYSTTVESGAEERVAQECPAWNAKNTTALSLKEWRCWFSGSFRDT